VSIERSLERRKKRRGEREDGRGGGDIWVVV
jgi:hypothetical protein